MAYQPPYDYNIHLGSVEAFDPRDADIGELDQKIAEGKQLLASALNIQVNDLPDFGGELYIVQLQAVPSDQDLDDLTVDYGLSFDHPLSDITYLERLTVEQLNSLNNAKSDDYSGIRAVVPYWPELKVHHTGIFADKISFGLYDEVYIDQIKILLKDLGTSEEKIQIDHSGDETVIYVQFENEALLDLIMALPVAVWGEKSGNIIEYNLNASGIVQSGNAAFGMSNPDNTETRFANELTHPIWERGIQGQGQVIGIVDGGELDLHHNFLRHAINDSDLINPGPDHRKVVGYHMPSAPVRQTNHGMKVVGCALGSHINPTSIFNQHRGGASEARLSYTDRLYGNTLQLHSKFEEFKQDRAFIINRSMGRNSDNRVSYGEMARKIDEFLYDNANEEYIFINAIPNIGDRYTSCGTIAKNAISVGGINANFERVEDQITHQFLVDNEESHVVRACFDVDGNTRITVINSNGVEMTYRIQRGQEDAFTLDDPPIPVNRSRQARNPDTRSTSEDLRIKPDILALSTEITSSTFSFDAENFCDTTGLSEQINRDDDNFSESSGSSLAAPHVAAAAALVRQYFQDGWYVADRQNGAVRFQTIYGTLVKAVLLNATVPLSGRDSYPFPGDGWGRLQLDRTLQFAPTDNQTLESGEVSYFRVFAFANNESRNERGRHPPIPIVLEQDVSNLKVTLVFNDYPHSDPNDPSPTKNQLSLVLYKLTKNGLPERMFSCNNFNNGDNWQYSKMTESMSVHLPFIMPSRSKDDLKNNVRQIVVENAEQGNWVLFVRFHHVHKTIEKTGPFNLRRKNVPKPSGFSVVISGHQP